MDLFTSMQTVDQLNSSVLSASSTEDLTADMLEGIEGQNVVIACYFGLSLLS